jgi:hypothetical protein
MQERYAGDIGDFVKLGLLRHVAAPIDEGGAGLTVALNWYLAPDESHNADGKHVAYLAPSHRHHTSLAACDPPLMATLAQVVATGRSVAALNASGALPAGSAEYSEMLAAGSLGRTDWHRRALATLADAAVVFADPDNGIRSSPSAGKLHKYALTSELSEYAARGQSLVVYQHADRSAPASAQAGRRLTELADDVRQVPVGTVISRRGSCRFFLVTATDDHAARVSSALETFVSRWHPHVELAAAAAPIPN